MSCNYSLHRDRGQVVPQWHKTASKFQRIRCTICFTSPKTKETTPAGKGHACCLLSWMSCWTSNAQAAVIKKSFWQFRTASQLKKRIGEKSLGPQDQRDNLKRLENRKADCCPLLRRITKLKCVNSEFKSVNTHPEEGCLQWLHGTMSEPPWKSH